MIVISDPRSFISLEDLDTIDDNDMVSVSRQAINFRRSELVHSGSNESKMLLIALNNEIASVYKPTRSRNSTRFQMRASQVKRIFKGACHIPPNAFYLIAFNRF